MSGDNELIGYVARQSLISAFTSPVQASVNIRLNSAFQKRMVTGDLKSDLKQRLFLSKHDIDILMIDLTDERLGIDILTSSITATHSVELVESNWLKGLKTAPQFVAIGSPRHWAMWKSAASDFVRFLGENELLEKTVIYYTPWAEYSDDNTVIPLFRNTPSQVMSRHLMRCAAYLEGHGLEVRYLPESLAVTTSQHEWGIAPYHYIDKAYSWISNDLEKRS